MADPFEALGLARAWPVDPVAVRDAQRRAAATWHPDRFTDPARRSEAAARLAAANESAATLLDPLSGAQALLEACAPIPRPPEPRHAPAFLATMMELREALDGDDGREAALATVADERARAEGDLRAAFASLLGGDASRWPATAEALGRLRALRRAAEGVSR